EVPGCQVGGTDHHGGRGGALPAVLVGGGQLDGVGARTSVGVADAGAAARRAVSEVPGIREAGLGVRRAGVTRRGGEGQRRARRAGGGAGDGRRRRHVADGDAGRVVGEAARAVGDAAADHVGGGPVGQVGGGHRDRGRGAAGDLEGAVVVE